MGASLGNTLAKHPLMEMEGSQRSNTESVVFYNSPTRDSCQNEFLGRNVNMCQWIRF